VNLSAADNIEFRCLLDSYVLQNVSHFVRSPLNVLGVNFGNFTLLSLACDRVVRGAGVAVSVSLVVVMLSGGVRLPVIVELDLKEIKCSTLQIVYCHLS